MANNGDDNDPELWVAIVSLVIALVALLGTVMQVLQQYYASATGFANCDERVMGGWHVTKKRVFKPKELRFEVQFEAPVIFVCPASNNKGPVRGAMVWHVDGTEQSQRLIMTDRLKEDVQQEHEKQQQQQQQQPQKPYSLRYRPGHGKNSSNTSSSTTIAATTNALSQQTLEKRIHTADNERATWVTMLTEFQRMENESDTWQESELEWHRDRKPHAQERLKPAFSERSLVVAVQAKPRSWDTMPPNIKKPYATTTMCHLVEMTAMLGLHWKEFDRSRDKYRAEGNGYVLTGSHFPDLGVMFNFQICGKARFKDNRIVPSALVKEYAFGIVPTIFHSQADERRLKFPSEEPRDLGFLLLGSTNEVAETVASFGCNTRTAEILRDDSKKHGHLFPLAFEILGMLSKTLYIPNTSFRMLPNPTVYTWDKKFFNLRKLLIEFKHILNDNDMVMPTANHSSSGLAIDALETIDTLRGNAEAVCRALQNQRRERGELDFTFEFCDELQRAIAWCDKYLTRTENVDLVEVVLREHIQEVLRVVNNEDETENAEEEAEAADRRAEHASIRSGAGGAEARTIRQTRVDRLNAAAPEQRHQVFMDIYFATVLPRVIRQAEKNLERRDTTLHLRTSSTPGSMGYSPPPTPPPAPSEPGTPAFPTPSSQPPQLGTPGTMITQLAPTLSPEQTSDSPLLSHASSRQLEVNGAGNDHGGMGRDAVRRTRGRERMRRLGPIVVEVRVTEIWCTLVFRMLCWLLLHDFHKNDRQVSSKSEVWGSRLPVYIG